MPSSGRQNPKTSSRHRTPVLPNLGGNFFRREELSLVTLLQCDKFPSKRRFWLPYLFLSRQLFPNRLANERAAISSGNPPHIFGRQLHRNRPQRCHTDSILPGTEPQRNPPLEKAVLIKDPLRMT